MDGEDGNGECKFAVAPPPLPTSLPNQKKRPRGSSYRPRKYDYRERLLQEHRTRLTRILRRLVDDRNWKDAALTFSVLDRSWPRSGHGCSAMDLRKNFLAAIQIVLRNDGGSINPAKIRQLCDIWTSRLKWSKMCVKERQLVQSELALFFLTHGRAADALQITKFLLRENESTNNPKLHFVHGMTSFHIWYSGLPEGMQLHDSGMPLLEQLEENCSNNFDQGNAENTKFHSSSRKVQFEVSTSYNSCRSIDNYKETPMEVNLPQKQPCEDFPSSALPAKFEEDTDRHPSLDSRYPSIFSCHGLDARLLPIQLNSLSGSMEEKIRCHMELLDENYSDAESHLHAALFSQPPLLAALIPYVQILLLGDKVKEALQQLKKLCQISDSAIPFRVRVALLEVFYNNQPIEICNCHETILKKDPTCLSSVEKLICFFYDGNYAMTSLLEMIGLHLDAATGNCNIWSQLASCLLSIQTAGNTDYEHDQISTTSASLPYSASCGISINFVKNEGKRSWESRCRWWSKHHFSKRKYVSEMENGDWQLLTCKAASALHLYGSTFEYVNNVQKSLVENRDDTNLSFLRKHIESPLKLYEILSKRAH